MHSGHSLWLWHKYFPYAEIVGLDLRPEPSDLPPDRVKYVRGSQADPEAIAQAAAHGPFDIIIDDASHVGTLTKQSFELLFFDHLASDGLYIIEDTAASVHFPDWPDHQPLDMPTQSGDTFHSYQSGTIGFLKQIFDQVATDCAEVVSMNIFQSMAVLRKRPFKSV